MTATITRDGRTHLAADGPSGPTTRCGLTETTYPAGTSAAVDCQACLAEAVPAVAANLRLHGAGDGSVMAYCGACREPLPTLPRPVTLAAVLEAWRAHLPAVHQPTTDLTAP